MPLFNPDRQSNYDELRLMQPKYLANFVEMDAIFRAMGHVLDQMEADMELVFNNKFIKRKDKADLDEDCEYFGIVMDSGRTVEEKRNMLLATYIGKGKISGTTIRSVIATLLGHVVVDIHMGTRLVITVDEITADQVIHGELESLFAARLPAQIAWEIIYQAAIIGGNYMAAAVQQADIITIMQR